MSMPGIQGKAIEVTVVGCYNLEDKEWIVRQDSYVCLEYGTSKCRTKTCTDGGKNPIFQEKLVFTLIEGVRELSCVVWNSHSVFSDGVIGCGRIYLQKVLTQGYDDTTCPLQSKHGRYAGDIRFILQLPNANTNANGYANQRYNSNTTTCFPMSHLSPYDCRPPAPIDPRPDSAQYPYMSSATYPPSTYPPTPPAGYPTRVACPPPVFYPPPSSPAGYPPRGAYPPAGYPPASPARYPNNKAFPTEGYPQAAYPPAGYHSEPYPAPPQAPNYYPPPPGR